MYSIHHVAVTASDFEVSLNFYIRLGFELLVKKNLKEKSKKIALLRQGNFKLELFWFDGALNRPESRNEIGNNVHEVGAKHFALQVDSIQDARSRLQKLGISLASEPAMGDSGYEFFFIRDPDGIWIEFVKDDMYN